MRVMGFRARADHAPKRPPKREIPGTAAGEKRPKTWQQTRDKGENGWLTLPAIPEPTPGKLFPATPVHAGGGLNNTCPPKMPEERPGWAPAIDDRRGENSPVARRGGGEKNEEELLALINGGAIGSQIASAIREIVMLVFEILTPIVNILGVAMIAIGLLIALGLRQEFLGFRLVIGGALALATVHLIVPLLLTYI